MQSESTKSLIQSDNLNLAVIVSFGAALTLILIVIFVAMLHFYRQLETKAIADERLVETKATLVSGSPHFPQPHEQFSPQLDLQTFRSHESNRLNSYGWVDQSNGIAHVPIALAIINLVKGRATSGVGSTSLQLQQSRPNYLSEQTNQ